MSVGQLISRFALSNNTFLRNIVIFSTSGTEYLVALSTSELVTLSTTDSLTLVNSVDFNQLEVISA